MYRTIFEKSFETKQELETFIEKDIIENQEIHIVEAMESFSKIELFESLNKKMQKEVLKIAKEIYLENYVIEEEKEE